MLSGQEAQDGVDDADEEEVALKLGEFTRFKQVMKQGEF